MCRHIKEPREHDPIACKLLRGISNLPHAPFFIFMGLNLSPGSFGETWEGWQEVSTFTTAAAVGPERLILALIQPQVRRTNKANLVYKPTGAVEYEFRFYSSDLICTRVLKSTVSKKNICTYIWLWTVKCNIRLRVRGSRTSKRAGARNNTSVECFNLNSTGIEDVPGNYWLLTWSKLVRNIKCACLESYNLI